MDPALKRGNVTRLYVMNWSSEVVVNYFSHWLIGWIGALSNSDILYCTRPTNHQYEIASKNLIVFLLNFLFFAKNVSKVSVCFMSLSFANLSHSTSFTTVIHGMSLFRRAHHSASWTSPMLPFPYFIPNYHSLCFISSELCGSFSSNQAKRPCVKAIV